MSYLFAFAAIAVLVVLFLVNRFGLRFLEDVNGFEPGDLGSNVGRRPSDYEYEDEGSKLENFKDAVLLALLLPPLILWDCFTKAFTRFRERWEHYTGW